MIGTQFEYLVMLLLVWCLSISVFWYSYFYLLKSMRFWLTLLIFVLYCFGIEIYALSKGWWHFEGGSIIGVKLFNVPIEEFILFILFGSTVMAGRETLKHETD